MENATDSVWVLATGRCGTRMFANTFQLSPNVRAMHDGSPLHPPAWDNGDPLCGDRLNRLNSARETGRVYVEASQPLTRMAGYIADELPRARFVHLHRDVRNVVISGFHRLNWYGKVWDVDPKRGTPHPGLWPIDPEIAARWPRMKRIERCIWRWTAVNKWAADFVDAHPDRCRSLPSSALFAPSLSKIFAVCDWAGIIRPDAAAVIHGAANKADYGIHRQLQYGPWPADWDRYLPHDLMERLGYV